MAFRFIHTADWQLGRRFGRFDDALSGQLSAQRTEVITRIARAAAQHDCAHVLVAGDVWDTTTPSNAVLRQPLDVMGEHPDVTWWLLPGNHDADGPDGLWDRVEARAPDNVRALRVAEPVELEPGVQLLPAPWARIHHGEDLTRWMESAQTPIGAIRIGLAHGSIKTFGTKNDGQASGETAEIIPPDRAASARLDYLALGDWHARAGVNARTHYPGTPEPDRFKTGDRGQVLLVEIDASGSEPRVTDIPTAQYRWPVISATLRVNGHDAGADVERQIEGSAARHTLAEIHLSGETTVAEWAAFEAYLADLTDRCAHVEIRGASSVDLKVVAEDLDALDAQGSVRGAAENLRARRGDMSLSESERQLAGEALRLLFGFAATAEPAS